MKKILFTLVLLPLISFSQWHCDNVLLGILKSDVHGDSVILKNDTALRNCWALYEMDVSQVQDTIIWLQHDTGSVAGCICYFNLSVTIDSLPPGHYYVKAFYESIEGDTTCYIGQLEFDITEQNNYTSFNIADEGQSDCFQFPVGIEQRQNDQDVVVYPSPTADYITIFTKDNIDKEIQILDISGIRVSVLKSSNTLEKVDVSAFQPGIYFIKIVSDKNFSSVKFCKF